MDSTENINNSTIAVECDSVKTSPINPVNSQFKVIKVFRLIVFDNFLL